MRPKMPCQRYTKGESWYRNDLDYGQYFAAVRCTRLPRQLNDEDHLVRHGYAVGFGQWFFFTAIEPALAFGRAARMSADCHAYGVYRAAVELRYCQIHSTDERVLHVAGNPLDRRDGEVEHLQRFVQGCKEHPGSSHWHPPTGPGATRPRRRSPPH